MRGLKLQAAAFFLGLILISFLYTAFVASSVITDRNVKRSTALLLRAGDALKSAYEKNIEEDRYSLNTLTDMISLSAESLRAEVWILSPDGDLVWSTNHTRTLPHKVSESFLQTSPKVQRGTYDGTVGDDSLSITIPLVYSYHTNGYIVLHRLYSDLMEEKEERLRPLYVFLIVLLVVTLIFLVSFTLSVILPLKKLQVVTEKYADGDFKEKPHLRGKGEISLLGANLAFMAERMEAEQEEQKKFIANISHDFRSPLTSIRGYLEAMLDGTIPPSMQEKYLGIVVDETDRLKKLTDNLLQLNSLKQGKVPLNRTSFDMLHSVKKVLSLFEQRCEQRGISFELLSTGYSTTVYADLEKIQQVLYNLIDNAIKFSPNNSVITIELRTRREKLFVSVRDRGEGIEKENLNLIWNRFYKEDSSRGKDKKGTGLGLAIVKDIIKSHHENIDCVSTKGVGTEFTFSLPMHQSE